MLPSPERLHVFISSRMAELADIRSILRRELERIGIGAFVYEASYGARPDDPEQASLEEVTRTDLFVLIIGESYGEITEREYDQARELNKPCLIYERLGAPRTDERLNRFLTKLSGPRNVPSRTAFRNADDLVERVAKDVQAWLVREYRRLSARQLSGTESTRRAAQLEDNIRRLAASSTAPLPSGNAADLLAWQLRQWFEALEYPIDIDPVSAASHVDLLVRVPARRRQFQRTLVRCKDGEIRAPDVTLALQTFEEQLLDEIWLVSQRRISQAARDAVQNHNQIVLYTLDELIEEDINFDRYFEWVETEVANLDLRRRYVPLAVTTNEINAAGKIEAQSHYEDLSTFVDEWLTDTDGEQLSLLGEFGTGKSWFALKYSADLIAAYRDASLHGRVRPRIPLMIRLRDYARGFKDVGSLLTEFVFREHQINIRSFAILDTLNRMGRLLFIFDGFDEMAARIDTNVVLLEQRIWNASDYSGGGGSTRAICVNQAGNMMAVVSTSISQAETAKILIGTDSTGLPLKNFRSGNVAMRSEMIDTRGAAFNATDSLLAICERPNRIGIWCTKTGNCLGHVRFEASLAGAILDGTKGLPETLLRANQDGRTGWEFEEPVND